MMVTIHQRNRKFPMTMTLSELYYTHTLHNYTLQIEIILDLFTFSESTIPDQMQFVLFCFESPKLSLSFFKCSCSPMNVKWSKIVSLRSVSSTNYPTLHHPLLSTFSFSFFFLHVYKFYTLPNITIYKGYKVTQNFSFTNRHK